MTAKPFTALDASPVKKDFKQVNFSTFAISDLQLTAFSNESLKDLYSFGSPLNLLIFNFGNFIFIVSFQWL